jgi:hypothetical protein
MYRLVARRWMLLVAVLVVAVAGFCVSRLHGIFGSNHNTATPSGFASEIRVAAQQLHGAPLFRRRSVGSLCDVWAIGATILSGLQCYPGAAGPVRLIRPRS